MKMKNKIAALTILTVFNFSSIVQAASIDEELAVIAAEQEEIFSNEKKSSQENVTQQKKSRKELRAEEKRLREEKKAEEKRIKEEMKSAEKEFKEAQQKSKDQDKKQLKISERDSSQKNFPRVDPVAPKNETVELEEKKPDPEVVTFNPTPATQTPATQTPATQPPATQTPVTQTPVTQPSVTQTPETVSLPNPVVMFSNFDELTNAVHFTPLYIPKKSGFSIDSMLAIDGNIAEIRYGRRWEPEVTLRIRTYKRAQGEELKDISGVYGVKWRVDMSGGTSVYIAKIEENKHVAAWATGDYTFSAQVDNLSFAAFHAIVIDELVDLSSHYYIK